MSSVSRHERPPAVSVGDVGGCAPEQPLARRAERKSINRRKRNLEQPRRRRKPAIAPPFFEKCGMASAELRVALGVPLRRPGKAATGLCSVVRSDLGDAYPLPAAFGERHPEIPILVPAWKLPTARLDQGRAPKERTDREMVLVADLPRIESRPASVDVLEIAEAFHRAPRRSRLRIAVENGAQFPQGAVSDEVVGVEGKNVLGVGRADTGRSRRRRPLVDLVDNADPGCFQSFQHRQGRVIRRPVVNQDDLGRRVLPLNGGHSLHQRRAVVEARDHDGDRSEQAFLSHESSISSLERGQPWVGGELVRFLLRSCRSHQPESAPGRNRTCDLALRRRALYPLSYWRGTSSLAV